MRIEMTIPELPGLLKKLAEIGTANDAKKALRKGLRKGANRMLATAKTLVPVHQGPYPLSRIDRAAGTLKRNLKTRAMRRSRNKIGYMVTSGTAGKKSNTGAAYYGHFLEYGTPRIKPRSFLRAPFDQHKAAAVDDCKAELKTAIEGAFAKKL